MSAQIGAEDCVAGWLELRQHRWREHHVFNRTLLGLGRNEREEIASRRLERRLNRNDQLLLSENPVCIGHEALFGVPLLGDLLVEGLLVESPQRPSEFAHSTNLTGDFGVADAETELRS